jgi:KDO2-lipid IV(A) lauroyltransferase
MTGKELRRILRARAVQALPGLLDRLGEARGRRICVGIGRAGHRLVGRDRRLARSNLARVYPGWSTRDVERTARRVFEEIGRNAFDFLRYPDLSEEERATLVAIEGREHLERALARGRGVVVVTGHLGCWELLAATLVREGVSLKALARPLREARLDAMLLEHRRRMGVETLSSQRLPVRAVRHLRAGGALGVLIDQRIRRGGVVVSFLDQPTRLTDAPARLALATGAVLLPTGIRRLPDHRHRVTIRPGRPVESSDTVAGLTRYLAGEIGVLIRSVPEQWMWIHPRWEGVPVSRPDRAVAGSEETREELCVG